MRPIHRILCPVDLSDMSRRAIAHAEVFAATYHAKITALHVCNPVVVPATDFALVGNYVPTVFTEEELKSIRRQIRRLFADAPSGIEVDAVVKSGPIPKRIVESAAALPAELIVIGTHGAGGWEHLVLGSVAEKVLRTAPCPVLTVPPLSHATSTLPFRRILCPIDFSAPSLAALEFARSLAAEGGAVLTLLYVLEWSDEALTMRPPGGALDRQAIEENIRVQLRALSLESPSDRPRPQIRVGHGKAYREILAAAASEASDLIVMGVHGRHALDLMLFGSTTNQVVRRATCPVVTVRT